jgi:cell wall-associated NlpC family hydrolase
MSPGDILLFARDGAIYHVGIALSASTFIHSASEGERQGVIISSLGDGNWRARLVGIRRLAVSH